MTWLLGAARAALALLRRVPGWAWGVLVGAGALVGAWATGRRRGRLDAQSELAERTAEALRRDQAQAARVQRERAQHAEAEEQERRARDARREASPEDDLRAALERQRRGPR